MQAFFDILPIVAFVFVLVTWDIFAATAVLMGAVLLQMIAYRFLGRPISKMTVITVAILAVFGGLTLLLRDPQFIKWKATVQYWLFALVFLGSQYIGQKNLTQRFYQAIYEEHMEAKVALDRPLWTRLNLVWVLTFAAMGAVNLYVFQHYDTKTWGYFKLVLVGVVIVITILQNVYVFMKYAKTEQA